jgi:hypothetical protein
MQLDLCIVYTQEANSGNAELGVHLRCAASPLTANRLRDSIWNIPSERWLHLLCMIIIVHGSILAPSSNNWAALVSGHGWWSARVRTISTNSAAAAECWKTDKNFFRAKEVVLIDAESY